jgi:DNA-binding transcriptional LysR family regulator
MTLQQLRIFVAVGNYLNVTRASKEVHIHQSTASEHLKALESEYGVQLLRRLGHGVELTEAGALLLGDAEIIVSEVEKLQQKYTAKVIAGKKIAVSVGGSHSPSASVLPLLSVIFKGTHPRVAVNLRTGTSQEIMRLLLNSEIELGVVTSPPSDPLIAVDPCWQERLVAFVSAKHPLAKKRKLTLAELASTPLIIKKAKEGDDKVAHLLKWIQQQGFELNIFMNTESPEATMASVQTGIGLGILYEHLVKGAVKSGELKILAVPELEKKMKVDISAIYYRRRPLSPAAGDFLTLLREWCKKRVKIP